jgi:addiction module HigA family antidote
MTSEKLPPIHPGEILKTEFIDPMGLNQEEVARALNIRPETIHAIVSGDHPLSANTALRLSRYFGTTPQFWLGLQMDYDLDVAEDELDGRIEKEVVPISVAG